MNSHKIQIASPEEYWLAMTMKYCHCEEQSDEVIHSAEERIASPEEHWFAMTMKYCHCEEQSDEAICIAGELVNRQKTIGSQ